MVCWQGVSRFDLPWVIYGTAPGFRWVNHPCLIRGVGGVFGGRKGLWLGDGAEYAEDGSEDCDQGFESGGDCGCCDVCELLFDSAVIVFFVHGFFSSRLSIGICSAPVLAMTSL